MPDDSLEYAVDINNLHTKANRKMVVVGRGRQLNALSTTYAGQYAFCTETENGFTVDTIYERDATNTSWNSKRSIANTVEETSETTVGNSTAASITSLTGRAGPIFTLPTTEKYYIITKFTWKNGNVIESIKCGVDVVDPNSTLKPRQTVAWMAPTVQVGLDTVQSNSVVVSDLIRGGTKLMGWWSGSSANARLYYNSGSSTFGGDDESYANALNLAHSPATVQWSGNADWYLQIAYRGYLPA